MSRYKDSNKYKIYGEDAILAARFDKYLDATLRNCRADYLKALSKRKLCKRAAWQTMKLNPCCFGRR